jgi:hypothetical protein
MSGNGNEETWEPPLNRRALPGEVRAEEIRNVLGHGAGFDSPGVKGLRHAMARLGEAFHAARGRAGLSLAELSVQAASTRDVRDELSALAKAGGA